jgi:hypothetical protein
MAISSGGYSASHFAGAAKTSKVSDHRGSNSQPIDFEGVEIYPLFTAKIENTEKSSA